jgi:hypothetical protein
LGLVDRACTQTDECFLSTACPQVIRPRTCSHGTSPRQSLRGMNEAVFNKYLKTPDDGKSKAVKKTIGLKVGRF